MFIPVIIEFNWNPRIQAKSFLKKIPPSEFMKGLARNLILTKYRVHGFEESFLK